jgi:hypothetical protein
MDNAEPSWRGAWEPLTPRGVAAFAGASLGRLVLVQFIVALLAGAAVVWLVATAWFPVVRSAIQQLPAEGLIRQGGLHWAGEPSLQLAENRFLGLAVDLYHSGQLGREAHLQIEFGKEDFRIYSLLGYQVIEYPPDWSIPFNQPALEPWWGAWQPFMLVAVGVATVIGLMASWFLLATIYCGPVHVISLFVDHDLSWGQSWRLAGAALLPGALFLIAGIVGYGLGWMDVIQLGGIFGIHFIVAWIYLGIGPLFCPKPGVVEKVKKNPFAGAVEKNSKAAVGPEKKKEKNENPFAS